MFFKLANPLAVVILVWSFVLIFCLVLDCHPIAYSWDKLIPGGHCLDGKKAFNTISGVGALIDIILLVLPIPWLWGLQMNRQKKPILVSVFLGACKEYRDLGERSLANAGSFPL